MFGHQDLQPTSRPLTSRQILRVLRVDPDYQTVFGGANCRLYHSGHASAPTPDTGGCQTDRPITARHCLPAPSDTLSAQPGTLSVRPAYYP